MYIVFFFNWWFFLENFVENVIFFKFLETLKMHVSKLYHTIHMHIISKGSRQGK